MYNRLKTFLSENCRGGIALAFSGGVDSSVLLAVLKELCDEKPFPLLALNWHSVFQRREDAAEVRRIAAAAGVGLHVIKGDPLGIPEVAGNSPRRCYWCKRHIFTQFRDFAASRGIAMVVDGTNADDLDSYRPGIAALRELGIVSPFAHLGISKSQVREIAARLNLGCAVKPSSPCMATRFEYGTCLTPALIRQVIEGEAILRRLVPEAVNLRLRHHGKIARIEVEHGVLALFSERAEKISKELRTLGFEFVTLDLQGFRSGSFDAGLDIRQKKIL